MRCAFSPLVIAILFSVAVANGATADDSPAARLLSHPCTRAAFAQLLLGAHPNIEVAAFIVEEDGDFKFLIWPRTNWFLSQHWSGTIPQNTIAIVHTHPPFDERPSKVDVMEASRLHLPFFVVTLSSIALVDGRSEDRVVSVERHWIEGVTNRMPAGCHRPRIVR